MWANEIFSFNIFRLLYYCFTFFALKGRSISTFKQGFVPGFSKTLYPLSIFEKHVRLLFTDPHDRRPLALGRGLGALLPEKQVAALVGDNSLLSNLVASVVGCAFYFATLTEIPILEALMKNGITRAVNNLPE